MPRGRVSGVDDLPLIELALQIDGALKCGNFLRAYEVAEKLLRLAPSDETRSLVAATSYAAGQYRRGLEMLAGRKSSMEIALRGKCLIAIGEFEAARELCCEALPNYPLNEDIWGVMQEAMARLNAAGGKVPHEKKLALIQPFFSIEHFRCNDIRESSVSLRPILDATTLLRRGRLKEGFAAFVALTEQWPASTCWAPSIENYRGHLPRWDGRHVRQLLVIADLGNGDILQFVRFCAEARMRVDKITLCAPKSLLSLLARCEGIDAVVPHDEFSSAIQIHDAYIPTTIFLPHVLGAEYGAGKYLNANQGLPLPAGMNVGLCWSSSAAGAGIRAIPEQAIEPFRSLGGITFHSLLPGVGPDWMNHYDLPDYAATASLVSSLDLVITCDTSVAHLAGGMGKEVWIMLPKPADWRWEGDETRSRWYPSARLFRQTRTGDWYTVIESVLANLRIRSSASQCEAEALE